MVIRCSPLIDEEICSRYYDLYPRIKCIESMATGHTPKSQCLCSLAAAVVVVIAVANLGVSPYYDSVMLVSLGHQVV